MDEWIETEEKTNGWRREGAERRKKEPGSCPFGLLQTTAGPDEGMDMCFCVTL